MSTMNLGPAAKMLAGLEKGKAQREQAAAREVRTAWVLSQVGTRRRKGETNYRCPDCHTWEPTAYTLALNHGWDVQIGDWPRQAGCSKQIRDKHRSFPVFAATADCVGCGPLRAPWTTAKRFYVMEEHLYHRDRLLPWSRMWAPLDHGRVIPEEVARAHA